MMVWSTITDIITHDRAFVNTKNKKQGDKGMKNLFKKIITEITWFFSGNVRQAINDGKSYDEVAEVVDAEVQRNVQ